MSKTVTNFPILCNNKIKTNSILVTKRNNFDITYRAFDFYQIFSRKCNFVNCVRIG